MKRTTAVLVATLALAAPFLMLAPSTAHAMPMGVWETLHLQPGQSWSYHAEDVDWPMLWVWKSVIAHDNMAQFSISESVMGEVHLEPGEMFHHVIESMTPYSDEEGFTNMNDRAQSLAGVVELPAIPDFDFNDPIQPGVTGHVFIAPQEPAPDGSFDAGKWIENVDDFTNWWGYESTSFFDPIMLDPGMEWHSHSHHENGMFTGYWLEITNTGNEDIWIDVHVEYEVPEPATLTLFALAGLALVGRRRP